jgi:hypothetical protein
VAFARGSGNRLTRHDLDRFPGDSLFERLARVVCEAGCLPRKELYETWEVARRVRRVFRGGRVADMAGGHGLLAHALLILDDSSPAAFVVDPIVPKSARRLHDLLVRAWPRLEGRIEHVPVGMDEVGLDPADVVVSCHACGALTDLVLSRASTARARVAVLPCCHDEETCDTGGLGGWLESSPRDRRGARDAPRGQRLSRLDADHSRGHHAEEPPAPGRAGGAGLSQTTSV